MPSAGGFVLDGGTYASRVAIFGYLQEYLLCLILDCLKCDILSTFCLEDVSGMMRKKESLVPPRNYTGFEREALSAMTTDLFLQPGIAIRDAKYIIAKPETTGNLLLSMFMFIHS